MTHSNKSLAAAALAFALMLSPMAAPQAMAQDTETEQNDDSWGGLLEGFTRDLEPHMETLRLLSEEWGPALESFLAEMGPALGGLMDEVKDWTNYSAPEMLPNGDIIMRRKPNVEETPETDQGTSIDTDGATDL